MGEYADRSDPNLESSIEFAAEFSGNMRQQDIKDALVPLVAKTVNQIADKVGNGLFHVIDLLEK
jgi:hypothetical protein